MTREPIRVIWNANAGQKVRGPLGGADDEELRQAMADAGLDADIVPTHSEDEARAAVAEAIAQKADLIVAAGGDGTIGRIAEQLLGTDVDARQFCRSVAS